MFQKTSGIEKIWIRRGEEYQDFPSKILCLTVQKNIVGAPFSVSLFSGTENDWIQEGEYQEFPSKFYSLTVPKNSVGEHFTVAIIPGIEKIWMRGGSITSFRRSFYLTVPKNFNGEHFGVSEKFFYRKLSCIGGGRASRFCRKFLPHNAEKCRRGTL